MADFTLKTCSKCRESKDRALFGVDRSTLDGLRYYCKRCCNVLARANRKRNPSTSAAAERRYRERNPEKVRAARSARTEKQREYDREYKRRNRERLNERSQAWREAHRDQVLEAKRDWRQRHPEVKMRRRALLRGASTGNVDLVELWNESHGTCGICADPIDGDLRHPDPMSRSVDHVVPLSKGGTHEQSNLQWTHLVCNLKKGASVPVITERPS